MKLPHSKASSVEKMILSVGTCVKDDKNNLYVLDEIIGQGGFGYVFKAHRKEDNKSFAIKTTLPSFTSSSSELAFKNEIQSATKIKGNNIIHYEYIHGGDTFLEYPPYIIMEYADGGTLRSLLEKRRETEKIFDNKTLLNIFRQLADGMRQINSHLIHRDIKPDNILLCGNTFKISGFGLSKVSIESTRSMSLKGGGTALYMAPEAWDLSKNTIQMDIYSMGIVFYELATLCYQYTPTPRTYEECKDAHLYSAITDLSKVNPALPPSLISLINRMLEKSTKKRFSDWNEIINHHESQHIPSSPIDEMVARVVATRNSEDAARQKREATIQQREREKNSFCKLVYSQFENTIIAPIVDFAEKVNTMYAGSDKIEFPKHSGIMPHREKISWKLSVPPKQSLTINFEVILKENFTRKVHGDIFCGDDLSREENYIPCYRQKTY